VLCDCARLGDCRRSATTTNCLWQVYLQMEANTLLHISISVFLRWDDFDARSKGDLDSDRSAAGQAFLWIAMHGRQWTGVRWKRHGLQDDDSCALCDQSSESTDHLLLSCVYTREVWAIFLRHLGLGTLYPSADDELVPWCGSSPDTEFRAPSGGVSILLSC
jgi:hypothetical protein